MSHIQSRDPTALMVIDVQQHHYPHCVRRTASLDTMVRVVRAARILGVPTVLTEHYPKVFGSTVEALAKATRGIRALPKIHFSCLADPGIAAEVDQLGVRNLVLIGTETHICICQTALQALEWGLSVAVVADAVTGRKPLDHDLALERLRAHGVDVLTWESLAYEWMRRGGSDAFREILPLVKAETMLSRTK